MPRVYDLKELDVDREFARLLLPLSPDEEHMLRSSLEKHGCLCPLVYWMNGHAWRKILLDGHRRYAICRELGIPYAAVGINLPSREVARQWVMLNQLGRRNAGLVAASDLLIELYREGIVIDREDMPPLHAVAMYLQLDRLRDQIAAALETVRNAFEGYGGKDFYEGCLFHLAETKKEVDAWEYMLRQQGVQDDRPHVAEAEVEEIPGK